MTNSFILAFMIALMVSTFRICGQNEDSIEQLIQQMTLEEKIGQVSLFTTDWESTGPTIRDTYKEDIRSGQCGALFNAHTIPFTRELQRIAVEETRLKIPLLFGYDVVHGYRTIFPIPLAESCTWDLDLIRQASRVAGREAAAAGLHWTFAPMVDISRDPRWGRVMEGAGEDTWYGSRVAEARVEGFQGNGIGGTDAVVSCVKHFAGYGAATAGRDYHYTEISPLTMRELYLPPFKAALDAGSPTVMTAFNDISGIPATAHKELLTDILRTEWGFDGFVVTDYTSINELVEHGFAENESHAAELAFNAGADMDMQGGLYQRYLAGLIGQGKVSMQTLDESVRRILKIKMELGLFEDPYKFSNQDRYDAEILSTENRSIAREVAKKSLVLLKNDNQALPLSKTAGTIAVIGPQADSQADLLGAWSAAGEARDCISLLSALKDYPHRSRITYHRGTGYEIGDTADFAAALNAARQADIIVMTMGENKDHSGEATSRANPIIPGEQMNLFRKIKALGKPVVVVLMNGRPLMISELAEEADAILEAWWAGVEGGPAIAEVLFGDYNPSGKLTMTFPRHVGQVPIYYNERNSGRPFDPNDKWNSKYIDMPNTPLYPFGYGLSYTTFEYSDLKTDKEAYRLGEPVKVSVTLQNTGNVAGEEVAQLYIRDLHGSTTRPIKELRGFQKIMLQPGQKQTLSFTLQEADLACYNQKLEFGVEPGVFHIMAGGNSADLIKKSIKILE